MVKTCRKCSLEKDISEFGKSSRNIDGLNNQCKKCSYEERRKYYLKNTEKHKKATAKDSKARIDKNHKWVGDYLLAHPCVDCGNSDVLVLEFDHTDDNKEDSIGRMMRGTLSLDKVKAEVAKCEVRCVNCHRKITNKRRRELKNG